MTAQDIHQAIARVKEIQEKVVENRRFEGFSGPAKAASGLAALSGAAVMSASFYPQTPFGHAAGWGVVCLLSIAMQQAALLRWFLFDPRVNRNPLILRPLIKACGPIFVGCVLTLAMIRQGNYEFLFGVWMCNYGLVHIGLRQILPRSIAHVGLFFIACGVVCLAIPEIDFTNPWPMGLAFFIGESAGAVILWRDRKSGETWRSFLKGKRG
jgi:hypothetical protein